MATPEPVMMMAESVYRDVHSGEELAAALRDERQRQGLSCEQVDTIAGLPSGYTCKLENPGKTWGRALGLISLPLLLGALRLKLSIAHDDEARPLSDSARGAIGRHPVTRTKVLRYDPHE